MKIIIKDEKEFTINLPTYLFKNPLILGKIVNSNEFLKKIGYKNIYEIIKLIDKNYKNFTFIEVQSENSLVKIVI